MKIIKSAILFFIMMAFVASSAAWAGRGYRHHGHHGSHVGIHFAAPLFFGAGYYLGRPFYPVPAYYPEPAYYYGTTTSYAGPIVNSAPTYIERGPLQEAGQDQSGYWYYCDNPQGYYPNVAQCSSPAGWQRVAPRR